MVKLTQKNFSFRESCFMSRDSKFGSVPVEGHWKSSCNSEVRLEQASFEEHRGSNFSQCVALFFNLLLGLIGCGTGFGVRGQRS